MHTFGISHLFPRNSEILSSASCSVRVAVAEQLGDDSWHTIKYTAERNIFANVLGESHENGTWAKHDSKRGGSNGSPEIPDSTGSSDVHSLPSGMGADGERHPDIQNAGQEGRTEIGQQKGEKAKDASRGATEGGQTEKKTTKRRHSDRCKPISHRRGADRKRTTERKNSERCKARLRSKR